MGCAASTSAGRALTPAPPRTARPSRTSTSITASSQKSQVPTEAATPLAPNPLEPLSFRRGHSPLPRLSPESPHCAAPTSPGDLDIETNDASMSPRGPRGFFGVGVKDTVSFPTAPFSPWTPAESSVPALRGVTHRSSDDLASGSASISALPQYQPVPPESLSCGAASVSLRRQWPSGSGAASPSGQSLSGSYSRHHSVRRRRQLSPNEQHPSVSMDSLSMLKVKSDQDVQAMIAVSPRTSPQRRRPGHNGLSLSGSRRPPLPNPNRYGRVHDASVLQTHGAMGI